MKRLLTLFAVTAMALSSWAIPAKKGQWKTLTLANGVQVEAQLVGDEHSHFWQTADGARYVSDDDVFVEADVATLSQHAATRRAHIGTMRRSPRRVSMGEQTHYLGKKKGIVILMQFTDTKFRTQNNLAKYKRILNEEGYNEGSFNGSVADYFKAQSGGLFELDFDVVGPYTAAHNYSYYGKNDYSGNDQHPDELIVEAVKAADAEVNFKDYDWDGDGEVDQVFVLYAGKGEADGGNSNTIWPHMFELSYTYNSQWLDGVRVNTYACSNEIDNYSQIEGIGVFCHEFSHCMGFPDFYDVNYSGWYGMGSWDLMCSGSYNGNGFTPAGYSAYEKWMSGWLEPTVLSDKGVTVENLAPMSKGGNGYIIYNDNEPNEYYMVENRQRTNWDAALPGKGLMITHVDFDKAIWEENIPNSKVTSYYGSVGNDHQRFTIFHADNTESDYNESTDLYPYGKKDSLTNTSRPAATLYNKNTDGSKFMNKPITAIKQNSDGTMSFLFMGGAPEEEEPVIDEPQPGDETEAVLFYESFDLCAGKGGNDGNWPTSGFNGTLTTDNEGWDFSKGYGGSQCARFGAASVRGTVTTPAIDLGNAGKATISFKAAGWNNDGKSLELSIEEGNATISPAVFTMNTFEWADYKATITGKGTVRITFTPAKRFILDEVKVLGTDTSTSIESVRREPASAVKGIFDLQGRRIEGRMQKGLYIINGRKYVVR